MEKGACGLAVEENLVLPRTAVIARGGIRPASERGDSCIVVIFVERVDIGSIAQAERIAHGPSIGRRHLHIILLFGRGENCHHCQKSQDAIFQSKELHFRVSALRISAKIRIFFLCIPIRR